MRLNIIDVGVIIKISRYPYNAEGRLSSLTESWVTPAGKHFVRNHCAVPDIDPDQYTLTITGEGLQETVFKLEDLKTKFPKVDVTTVIQCNGNRREDFHYLGMFYRVSGRKVILFLKSNFFTGGCLNTKITLFL